MIAKNKCEMSVFDLYANLGGKITIGDCPYESWFDKTMWFIAVRKAANACGDYETSKRFHPENR